MNLRILMMFTSLYFLLVSIYVLVYIALAKRQPRTVIISHITPGIFNQLYLEHSETLSCPCSTMTVSYRDFVSTTVTLHSVCSSIFVSQQWIEALYLPDASRYGVTDFRTTANTQVIHYLFFMSCLVRVII